MKSSFWSDDHLDGGRPIMRMDAALRLIEQVEGYNQG
jgi:hypothetical protein